MTRMARILLVEPEETLRRALDRRLEDAGHEVASVLDLEEARRLLDEGLAPDVVVAEAVSGSDTPQELRDLAPRALHLRIVRENAPQGDFVVPRGAVAECGPDPAEVLRRLEEVLLDHDPVGTDDLAGQCMDLARRLACSLPRAASTEERIDLVTDGFDNFFGVAGSYVVRRGPGPDDWIEVSQGLPHDQVGRIAEEIARRSAHRDIRPFLTRVSVGEEAFDVACLAVQIGEEETDLALVLRRAPEDPGLRESLMNLVGSAVRAAMTYGELERTSILLEAHRESFRTLLQMSRELTQVGGRRMLASRLLGLLNRELSVTRAALFVPRAEQGMLDLLATVGFPALLLERIGLSGFHGVGAECLASDEIHRLALLEPEGAAARELSILSKAGLRWAIALRHDTRPLGLLFFGGLEDHPGLPESDGQVLRALQEAGVVALRNLDRIEDLQDLAVRTLRGLVAAGEIRRPGDRGHAERVTRNAVAVGRALGLSALEIRDLAYSAMLHDVGKIVVSDPADGEGNERSRLHPVAGSRILSGAKPAASVVQGVEQHHERVDGLGFPYGLRGSDIHLFARIIAVADAYDRMIHTEQIEPEEALRRLETGAGLLWDVGIVAVFGAEIGRRPSGRKRDESWLEEIIGAP